MTKINTIVSGLSESIKAKFKEMRIEKALDMAKLNAQETLETAKMELEELPGTLSKDASAQTIIDAINAKMEAIEDAEAALARVDKIEAWLKSSD